MFNLDYLQLSSLHTETIRRQAAAARLLHRCQRPRPSLAERTVIALGDCLIRTGQRLKEAPHRLQAEQASLSSLTITL
jgi:hypothetical protein